MQALRFRLIAVFALMLVMGLAGVVQAEDSNGKFKQALADNATFTVTENGQDQNYQLAKDAVVMIDAQTATLSDLKAGDIVQVTWELRDGRRMASLVTCNRL